MTERVLFSGPGGVRVTNARANLGGKTYAMRNVTSVSMTRSPADRSLGSMIITIAVLMTIGSVAIGVFEATVVGIIGVLLGLWIKSMPRDRYHVVLGSASGETEALTSTSRAFVEKVVDALNEAIIIRG